VQIHYPREEGLLTQSIARRPSDPRVHTHLLSHNNQWGNGEKTSFCWQPATRLTGLISPSCDRYVQYLLVGANPSVLNWHRRGATALLSTYHSPTFLTDGLPFPPTGPSGLQFKGTYAATWPSNHSALYRGLQLCLVIANDLSLAIGSTSVYWNVTLMQLGYQFNSYNLMHNQEL
jgi:hypothetical protein